LHAVQRGVYAVRAPGSQKALGVPTPPTSAACSSGAKSWAAYSRWTEFSVPPSARTAPLPKRAFAALFDLSDARARRPPDSGRVRPTTRTMGGGGANGHAPRTRDNWRLPRRCSLLASSTTLAQRGDRPFVTRGPLRRLGSQPRLRLLQREPNEPPQPTLRARGWQLRHLKHCEGTGYAWGTEESGSLHIGGGRTVRAASALAPESGKRATSTDGTAASPPPARTRASADACRETRSSASRSAASQSSLPPIGPRSDTAAAPPRRRAARQPGQSHGARAGRGARGRRRGPDPPPSRAAPPPAQRWRGGASQAPRLARAPWRARSLQWRQHPLRAPRAAKPPPPESCAALPTSSAALPPPRQQH